MAVTLRGIATSTSARLDDASHVIWAEAEVLGHAFAVVDGLYPLYYRRRVDTTTAEEGPLQDLPTGARNLHRIGLKRVDSNRVRKVRDWEEGEGEAYVPKTGIEGQTIVWAWTTGFDAVLENPDDTITSFPTEALEFAILRTQVTCLESLLSSRVKQEQFHALHVRPGVTEEDILSTLEALHASIRDRAERAVPLPEVEK